MISFGSGKPMFCLVCLGSQGLSAWCRSQKNGLSLQSSDDFPIFWHAVLASHFTLRPRKKNEKKGETKRLRDWQCSHLPTMTSSTITFTCLRHVFWDKTIENTIFRPQKSSNHTDKPHGFCCQTKTYTPPAQRPQPAWTSTKISRSSKPCFNKTSLYWERPEGQGRIPFKPRKWIKNQKDSPKLRVLKAHTHTQWIR